VFPDFSLTLMVTHACNLRCAYCYTGAKFRRLMTSEIAIAAIDRAVRSTSRQLEIGFFGGEPLLEAAAMLDWIEHARRAMAARGIQTVLHLTTNGTLVDAAAWQLMSMSDLHLSVSHDGLPDVHDRYRRSADGHGSSASVLNTMDRLQQQGRDFNVVMVVRPDTVSSLPEGIEFLSQRGVRQMTPSLDLWTAWTSQDLEQLQQAISRSVDFWRQSLPTLSISWFDEKAARLSRLNMNTTARCQFGHGQIAVSPAGNLYPCERLIGEDRADNAMRLPGHALDGDDFCQTTPFGERSHPVCSTCALEQMCGTSCRCSNFIRTGDATTPDGLLCWLETTCFRETARVLNEWPVEREVEAWHG
jgi:uncharacterized protein